jgi:hypothetical protein
MEGVACHFETGFLFVACCLFGKLNSSIDANEVKLVAETVAAPDFLIIDTISCQHGFIALQCAFLHGHDANALLLHSFIHKQIVKG